VHDQSDTVLAALPALELIPLAVSAESVAGEEIREPSSAVCRFTERASPIPAHGHRAIGNDVGDGVEHRPYGPLAHGFGRLRRRSHPDAEQIQRVVAHDLSDVRNVEAG
jgi:hypothetical protein